jgi:hypothetical protein
MKQYSMFEDLQALGTEKIHEQTHISRDKVELLMNKAYEKIGRVQFMGYISILEREYGIDLSSIKEEYNEFYNNNIQILPPKPSVILQAQSSSKPKWILAGIMAIIALMVGGYWLQAKLSNAPQEDVLNLTTSAVEVAEEVAETNLSEENETNTTAPLPVVSAEKNVSEVVATEKPLASSKQLLIHPSYKVWYGMIDLASLQRKQNITIDPIVIDTEKNWLIVMGHGRIEIEYPEGKTVLNDKNTVHFMCENGALKQITQKEFIERNGGKNW